MLRYLTAGESHGKGLVAILEGMPAGLKLDLAKINQELKRRQAGLGRGKRMQIEKDKTQIISGLKKGITLGSPIAFLIENKDFSIERLPRVTCPRPGHADLAGLLKYGFADARNVLERASARETASRVGIGAICKIFLAEFRIRISSHVLSIGGESTRLAMIKKISEAKDNKDTVGGIFEVIVKGAPCGLGSYVQADRRLDGRIAQAVMSIPGVKGVEIGLGFGYADKFGSEVHDAIYYTKNKSLTCSGRQGYFRKTNHAGGIEGGISNGEDIILRACMKPISTLTHPLDSVNIITKKPAKATVERSDICVVESAGVIAESVLAYVLADTFLEKFGSDCLSDIKDNYHNYLKKMR
ncbi:MAG: chorismate synthase [Candidatus Omnitrophica bacterium CG23_combo_of_CG06-09_8_20_14_all_40_11]|nr:MAG: chorismate synthase [Candidatus Omnitrophica bacterium CG23_combo_of_CG06-09_8_20_14_all_40_11]